MKQYLFVFLFLLSSGISSAQDARTLLRKVNEKFSKVKDYQADLNLKTDIPFIKMLPVKAKIYFRQPYLMRIRSTGIAILPRQGYDQMFKSLADTASYAAVYQGKDPADNSLEIVNIIPNSDTSDLVLGRFWINPVSNLIMRSQITSKTNGTIQSEYFYGAHSELALPDSLVVTVDTKKFKIPKAVSADINNYNAQAKDPSKQKSKGKIYMRFSNYIINKGVPEKMFR
jgi:hypothetical protein